MKKKVPLQQPSAAPKKKRRIWLYVIGGIIALGIIGSVLNPSGSDVPTASTPPDGTGRSAVVSEVTSEAVSEATPSPTATPTPEPTPTPEATPVSTPVSTPTPAQTPEAANIISDSDEGAVEEDVVYVWIPASGSKYHSNAGCSNMKNPQQITLEEAIARGYEPCKKCY